MSCAAAAWVSFRWRMVRPIRTTNPALIRCSPASGRPRSANTLPVLGCRSRASLFGILHLASQLLEPLPYEFHLRFRRRDPGLGFLLESVDHVNRFSDRDCVDRAVGSTRVIGHNLHHLNAKPMQWLGRSEEHTSELQSLTNLVCRLLL